MRKALRILAVTLSLTLVISVAQAAVKAGSACSKLGSTSTVSGKKYTCIKSGKKLVWDKGVVVAAPKPSSSPSSSPTSSPSATATPTPKPTTEPLVEGHDCPKMGMQGSDATGLLECRHVVGGRMVYTRINNDFSAVINPISPDTSSLCRLADMRPVFPINTYSIAYPPRPFSNYKSTGSYKVVVVGIDFSDVPGTGSPSSLFKDDLVKASEWLKWYTNDKVKFDFVSYPQWFRAPKTSDKYDSSNHGAKAPGDTQAGGLTGQEIADDYVHAIEDTADLSNVSTIWFYFPENITKIVGQWTQQSSHVVTKKYGTITPQLAALGADTYLSRRVRWGFFLHEMIHGFGLQGHSPKYIPVNGKFTRIGMMSTADGWTNALLPWDAMTWGVDKPSDTYCIDKSHLSSVDLKLVPLEREQEGNRSIMIKLNDHQVLLVESHRSDKWGVGEGQGFAGVMVALIDTTVSTSFDDNQTVNDPATTSTGVYLLIDGVNHGYHQPIGGQVINGNQLYGGVGLVNGVGIAGDYEGWDLNHIMYTGESLTSNGIKVTLIKGGDNDTVRIEKIG
jgi:hypothetical protein